MRNHQGSLSPAIVRKQRRVSRARPHVLPWVAPEYGMLDKVNYMRGFIETFTALYPQLQDLDFTTQANKLDVLVYLFEGRKDVNAMVSLAEHYYNVLQAPHRN